MASIRVTKKAFKKVAKLMQNTMKKIISGDLNPSTSQFRNGDLVKQLKVSTDFDEKKGKFSFILNMPFYGKFFDSGVLGSGKGIGKRRYVGKRAVPNPDSFYDIGQFKGKSIGTKAQPTNLPFTLNTHIAYFGLQPKPFINQGIDVSFEEVVDKVGPDFADEVFNAVKDLTKKSIKIS